MVHRITRVNRYLRRNREAKTSEFFLSIKWKLRNTSLVNRSWVENEGKLHENREFCRPKGTITPKESDHFLRVKILAIRESWEMAPLVAPKDIATKVTIVQNIIFHNVCFASERSVYVNFNRTRIARTRVNILSFESNEILSLWKHRYFRKSGVLELQCTWSRAKIVISGWKKVRA